MSQTITRPIQYAMIQAQRSYHSDTKSPPSSREPPPKHRGPPSIAGAAPYTSPPAQRHGKGRHRRRKHGRTGRYRNHTEKPLFKSTDLRRAPPACTSTERSRKRRSTHGSRAANATIRFSAYQRTCTHRTTPNVVVHRASGPVPAGHLYKLSRAINGATLEGISTQENLRPTGRVKRIVHFCRIIYRFSINNAVKSFGKFCHSKKTPTFCQKRSANSSGYSSSRASAKEREPSS